MSLILTDKPAPHIRQVVLNRPDRLNAMTAELVGALRLELEAAARDRGCRAIVLSAAGSAFCAGLDLHGYRPDAAEETTDLARERFADQEEMSRLILSIREIPQPVIVAVNGPAAGFGFALALACDIRLAATTALFRAAFINIGVSNCDMGTSWLLPRLIGAARAHEIMLTARRVDAEEAERIGLVSAVLPDDQLLDRAIETAAQIAELSPLGVRMTKRTMWTALELPSERAAVELEDRQQILATFGPDMPEAVDAFLTKRTARFQD